MFCVHNELTVIHKLRLLNPLSAVSARAALKNKNQTAVKPSLNVVPRLLKKALRAENMKLLLRLARVYAQGFKFLVPSQWFQLKVLFESGNVTVAGFKPL